MVFPRITPIDGWGFHETVDGRLASPFDVRIDQSAFAFHPEIVGWKAHALNGKYAGSYIEMTPRNQEWTSVVVLHVYPSEFNRAYFFSGMANVSNLDCSWK